MDSNPICQPSPTNKMKCSFLDYVQLLMISRAGQWNQTPSTSPLQPKKMKCYFLDYVQLLMISWACQWTWTPSTTCLQPKKWNAHILIMFPSDDWPGWSMDLNPIHHPSPAKKMKSSFLYYVQLLMLARLSMDSNPICHPPQPTKWNPHFWITFNFWWLAGLVDGLKPHPPQLFSQKMKSSFLDYVQLLMISQAGQWTQTLSATPLQPKKWNAHFWIMFNFRLLACRSMDSNPICKPSPTNKMKCSFLEYVQLLMISLAALWTQTPSASPLQPKKWNATFGLRSTSDDWLG